MKISNYIFLSILVFILIAAVTGCTGSPRSEEAETDSDNNAPGISDEATDSGTDAEAPEAGIEWQPSEIGENLPEQENPVIIEASPEVIGVVTDLMDKLGYDISKLSLTEQMQIFNTPQISLWNLAFDGENGPVATAYVREDLMRIENFIPDGRYAPQAVPLGGDLPSLTIEAIGFDEMGYENTDWLSMPGRAVYRKRVLISEWDVCVGNLAIVYNQENGKLIGIDLYEFPALESFDMEFYREDAVRIVADDLNNEGLVPENVDLIQIVRDPSKPDEKEIFWELTYDQGYIYVSCADGSIIMSQAGPSIPLGF